MKKGKCEQQKIEKEDRLRDLSTMVKIWLLFWLWWETVVHCLQRWPLLSSHPYYASLCNVTLRHLPSTGESIFPLLELGLAQNQEHVGEVTPWDTWDSASRAPTASTLSPWNAALSHQVNKPWWEAMGKRTRSSQSAASTYRQGGHLPVDHPNPGKHRMTAVTRVIPGRLQKNHLWAQPKLLTHRALSQ